VNSNLHTVKITGHLTFYSSHKSFRTAFRDFIENPDNGGIQLQITDMVNTGIPSMEIGTKISISRTIADISDTRFAQPDDSKPQVIEPPVEKVVPISIKTKPKSSTDTKTKVKMIGQEAASDACFY
jgi:hypothetical protein